jgi:hypothetical protein
MSTSKYQFPPRKSSNFLAQYDNANKGALFRNTDKVKETDRDYSGSINVDGTDYWISGWVKTSKAGAKYLSLSLKPKAEPAGETKPPFDDQIGF